MMEFTEEEIRDVFKLLSGVLQIGNIEFMTAGGAQITTKGGSIRIRVCLKQLYCLYGHKLIQLDFLEHFIIHFQKYAEEIHGTEDSICSMNIDKIILSQYLKFG